MILIHGYQQDKSDMFVLKENLEKLGYQCLAVDLPLTFKPLKYSAWLLKKKVKKILARLPKGEQISLVGHSTGGLVIRSFVANTKKKRRIGRCVLIATPNQGSYLADLAAEISGLAPEIFRTLGSLQTEEVKQLEQEVAGVEMGAIAGNKNALLLGALLSGPNDGRVTVESVKYEGLSDFVVLPYHHQEIHYQFETAKLVDSFLKRGSFK